MSERINEDYLSSLMKAVLKTAQLAARSNSRVLLQGESGSGKDYLARYIHDHSKRSKGSFLVVNCAALPAELIESELFGYESGAFTGAKSLKKGLIEAADGGTLLLNEIGEIPFLLQAKLLTFLDTGKFTRVGGLRPVRACVRIIAATNRDLALMVANGTFRLDLFHRLNVVTIVVPPLRDHREDIPRLAKKLLAVVADGLKRDVVPPLEPTTLHRLFAYYWPGNVRELENLLERCLVLSSDERQFNDLVTGEIRKRSKSLTEPPTPTAEIDDAPIIKELLCEAAGKRVRSPSSDQKRHLREECLVERHMKQVDIAKKLGVSPSAVCKWLQSLGEDDEV